MTKGLAIPIQKLHSLCSIGKTKMCKQHNPRKIDKCIIPLLQFLSGRIYPEYKILGCCCGHGKYPMTLIMKHKDSKYGADMFSNKLIPRIRRIYIKDKQGYYYIPETVLPTKHNSG